MPPENLTNTLWKVRQTGTVFQLFRCDELISDIRAIHRGIDFVRVNSKLQVQPRLTFSSRPKGYSMTLRDSDDTLLIRNKLIRNTATAAANLHYYLCDWIAETKPTHVCLHCGAAEIGGRLVIFPNRRKVGKSTLMVSLAAAGMRVFGDDFLLVDPKTRNGIGGGALPRLRLPLPFANMPRSIIRFIEDRIGVHDHLDTYIALREHEFAPYGTKQKIGGVVLLERHPRHARARLTPISTAEALRGLIDREFDDEAAALDVFELLHRIAATSRCFKLQYSELGSAVRALLGAFGK